jgi:CDGSH-type Zn-finger protein
MDQKPKIIPRPNGPLRVEGLSDLTCRKGPIPCQPAMSLCRCGGSANKPFCDGTHRSNGFASTRHESRVADRRVTYRGREIDIHDNRGLCAHAGHCTDGLPAVFRMKQEPWIAPDGADREAIAATIRKCPSGALSYSVGGVEHRERGGKPSIYVSPDGPYVVTGGPELHETAMGEGAPAGHYTLCRCGGSKNKPFCDGTHWQIGFKDDKN